MSLYRAFFKIIKKNLVSILVYFGITVGILVLLGGIYSDNSGKKAELDSYNIYVEDHDDSEYSRAVVDYLKSIHKVEEKKLEDDQIRDLLYYEQIVSYIRIPEGFGDTFETTGENKIVNTYDDAMPVGISITLQIDNYLNAVRDYVETGESIDAAAKKVSGSLDITKYVSIHATQTRSNEKMKGAFIYIPFGILTIMFMALFPAVVAFNKGEKRNRITVSSMSAGKRNRWIFMGAVTFAFITLAGLVILASIMGSRTSGDVSTAEVSGQLFDETWWLAFINVCVFTIVTAMMISMFANIPAFSNAPASIFSTIIGLGFSFLGGTFVPLDILGEGVTRVSRFLPNYWYSTAVNRIFDGGTINDVWDCLLIQLSFGLVCLFIGLAVAKITAERKQIA